MPPTPATIGRLYDGHQLVKRINLHKEGAPEVIQTNDMPPPRLRELDASLHEDSSRRAIPFSIWNRTGWGSSDYLSYDEWMTEFGPNHPPEDSLLERPNKSTVVVVRYADYQRQGGRIS